jgi:hypothetical protein
MVARNRGIRVIEPTSKQCGLPGFADGGSDFALGQTGIDDVAATDLIGFADDGAFFIGGDGVTAIEDGLGRNDAQLPGAGIETLTGVGHTRPESLLEAGR